MRYYLSILLLLFFLGSCGKKETEQTTTTEQTSSSGTDQQIPNANNGFSTGTSENNQHPLRSTPEQGQPPGNTQQPREANILVEDPTPNSTVSSTEFEVRGKARTFENGVAYRLTATTGKILDKGFTTAKGEMGTFGPFSFTAKAGYTGNAILEVFQNSAKDGSEIDKVVIPIKLTSIGGSDQPANSSGLKVFFTNPNRSPNDCSAVYVVLRPAATSTSVAREATQLLLQGPTSSEQSAGYSSQIPSGTTLLGLTITNGVAKADFGGTIAQAAGSCRVQAIRAQITNTLRQFPTVQSVVIMVNGKSGAILQP